MQRRSMRWAPCSRRKAVHTGPIGLQSPARARADTRAFRRRRVDEVIDLVGLREVAAQTGGPVLARHGPATRYRAALLGDPPTVMLDEPVNGLDPEGVHWIRNLLKQLAAEGRTVFVSSHLMSEMALTADHLIVIGRGRLIADVSADEFVEQASGTGFGCGTAGRSSCASSARVRRLCAAANGCARGRGPGSARLVRLRGRARDRAARARRARPRSRKHSWKLTRDDVEFKSLGIEVDERSTEEHWRHDHDSHLDPPPQ